MTEAEAEEERMFLEEQEVTPFLLFVVASGETGLGRRLCRLGRDLTGRRRANCRPRCCS
jgi:hypothetical protein